MRKTLPHSHEKTDAMVLPPLKTEGQRMQVDNLHRGPRNEPELLEPFSKEAQPEPSKPFSVTENGTGIVPFWPNCTEM